VDVLVFGGTAFVGRTIVEDLLERGHVPTLFTRGRTGAELFPGVERLVGDRDTGDYDALDDRQWDAVVDVSAYVPRHIGQAVAALRDGSGRYLFISTGIVYDRTAVTGEINEATPRLPPYRLSEEIDDDTYGPLKVACEDDLVAHFGDRATIVRPGWVVGPYDPSDRLTYWVRRAGRGGRIAVPPRLDRPVQLVDVRDLARLVVLLLEQDRPGAYNAVGPSSAITLGELIAVCGAAEMVSVPDRDTTFPLVLPDASWDVLLRMSAAAAHAVGMPQTPLEQTVARTRAWDRERGEPPLKTGLTEEQEGVLLA